MVGKYHLFADDSCYMSPFALYGYVGVFGSPREAAVRWERGTDEDGCKEHYCDGQITVVDGDGKLSRVFWMERASVPWGSFTAWVSSKTEMANFATEVRDVYRDNKAEVSREAAERAGVDLAEVRDRHKPEVPRMELDDSAVAYLVAVRDVLLERVGWVPLAEREPGQDFSRWVQEVTDAETEVR